MSDKQTAAIVLAAGKGTRMKSSHPKVTFPLAGIPLIERVVMTLQNISIDNIAIVVGYKKDEVISCVSPMQNVFFIEQKEQLGTGNAVAICKDYFKDFNGYIFILAGDVPLLTTDTLSKLKEKHIQTNADATVLTAILDDAKMYGRIIRDKDGNVERIVEFKDANEQEREIKEINTGIFCFNSPALFSAVVKIDNNNKQKEYYLTDTLEILKRSGMKVSAQIVEDPTETSGVNSQLHLAELEQKLYEKIKEHFLNNGVVIENPQTVIIEDRVKIENDVHIYPNCIIRGKTVIKSGSNIGANSVIINSILNNNVQLEGFNFLEGCEIPSNTKLQPFKVLINQSYVQMNSTQRLYSPWRMDYIKSEKTDKCILCNRVNEGSVKDQDNNDKKQLILYRGKYSYVIMNLYPYNNGHLMVVPYKHCAIIENLSDDELLEMIRLLKKSVMVLKEVYHPDGFNIGMNIGTSAGAGIPEHLHIHIVPRWNGDTNFITTTGLTRVIPEDFNKSFAKLKKVFVKKTR